MPSRETGRAFLGRQRKERRERPPCRSPMIAGEKQKDHVTTTSVIASRRRGNLLVHRAYLYNGAGDCTTGIPFGHHVGLWPPRNDRVGTWCGFAGERRLSRMVLRSGTWTVPYMFSCKKPPVIRRAASLDNPINLGYTIHRKWCYRQTVPTIVLQRRSNRWFARRAVTSFYQ